MTYPDVLDLSGWPLRSCARSTIQGCPKIVRTATAKQYRIVEQHDRSLIEQVLDGIQCPLPDPKARSPSSFQRRRDSMAFDALRTLAPAVSIPRSTARSSSARPALMIKPPSWILRRVSAFRSVIVIRVLTIPTGPSARRGSAQYCCHVAIRTFRNETGDPLTPWHETRVIDRNCRLASQEDKIVQRAIFAAPETPDMEWAGGCYDVVELTALAIEQGSTSKWTSMTS